MLKLTASGIFKLLFVFMCFAGIQLPATAQTPNQLLLKNSEELSGKLQVKIDLSNLDAKALEELQTNREAILAKYTALHSIVISKADRQATVLAKPGEIRAEDVVNVMQSVITTNADRALQDRYKEDVRKSKTNQR